MGNVSLMRARSDSLRVEKSWAVFSFYGFEAGRVVKIRRRADEGDFTRKTSYCDSVTLVDELLVE